MKKAALSIISSSLVLICLLIVPVHSQPQRGDILAIHQSPHYFELLKYDFQKKAFQTAWTSSLFSIDKDTLAKYRDKGPLQGELRLPLISDIDGDGQNELVALDRFGVIIFGNIPVYCPFPTASAGTLDLLMIDDVNKDGKNEIVTSRLLAPGGSQGKVELACWRIDSSRLKNLWSKFLDGNGNYVLVYGDVNNDGEKELVTALESIDIWKKGPEGDWRIIAELPCRNIMVDVVRVADVDGDGKNEILATGNGGVLTIYKHGWNRDAYPVIWQSDSLMSEGLKPLEGTPMASAYTQGLAVGDLDGDGNNEILVGTTEHGMLPNNERISGKGKIHIFRFAKADTYKEIWTSDWTLNASIPAFAVGDLDADGRDEFVYNGTEIYKFMGTDSQYTKIADLPPAKDSVIGQLSTLQEPHLALRIIPVAWGWRGLQALKPEQSYKTSLIIKNVWAEAHNVVFNIKSAQSYIKIGNGTQKIDTMESGEVVESGPITVEIRKLSPLQKSEALIFETIWVEITADGRYKQSVPLTLVLSTKEEAGK